MMDAGALREGSLFVWAHLLVCVIPYCHVWACLLGTLGSTLDPLLLEDCICKRKLSHCDL